MVCQAVCWCGDAVPLRRRAGGSRWPKDTQWPEARTGQGFGGDDTAAATKLTQKSGRHGEYQATCTRFVWVKGERRAAGSSACHCTHAFLERSALLSPASRALANLVLSGAPPRPQMITARQRRQISAHFTPRPLPSTTRARCSVHPVPMPPPATAARDTPAANARKPAAAAKRPQGTRKGPKLPARVLGKTCRPRCSPAPCVRPPSRAARQSPALPARDARDGRREPLGCAGNR